MVVIPILITPGGDKKSTMLLLMDTLFPIFNLVTMFGWESSSNNNDNITIVPLDPENCVDTEDSSSNCKRLKEYIEKWMGYRFLVLDNTNATSSSSSSFCASHGAAGIGMLTATGLSRRGHHVKDFSKIRNTGRGPLFWDFTRLILKNQFHTIRHRTAASTATMMTVVQVAVEQQSNDMLHSTTNISFLCESLKQSLDLATTSIHDVLIADDDTTDNDTILSIAANSNIWIATAKDEYNTWPAMFLPRDSTLILLYDETQQVTVGKQRQQKRPPVMQDFDVWNHMSHLKVHWLSLQNNNHDNSSQGNHHLVKEITRLIQMETTIKESSAIPDRKGGSPDGVFNGKAIHLIPHAPLLSRVHCVGENWSWDSMNYRSCQIENLCFDLSQSKFVILSSSEEAPRHRLRSSYDVLATNEETQVMMGQSVRLGSGTPWFPNRTTTSKIDQYYSLESNVVWLPYYAEQPNSNNPGHLLWDYWLPLFNLVELFGYRQDIEKSHSLFLTNIHEGCVSHAPTPCYNVTTKFLSLLGVDPLTFFNNDDPHLFIKGKGGPKSNFVCAPRGFAGIGMLTDHGFKKHGQLIDDYQNVQNVGRGVTFWGFRNYMLENMGIMPFKVLSTPYKITFSINSSNNLSRRRNFQKQVRLLEQSFPKDLVKVQTVVLGALSLEEQISIVQESAILVSAIGGSASTAMFMERNTCLILYYNDLDDFVKGAKNKMPNMMDWDFWNNASYLRVHWLPIQSMDSERDLGILVKLVGTQIYSMPFML